MDVMSSGCTTSGIYTIKPADMGIQVHCDMDTDNGGWTVCIYLHIITHILILFIQNKCNVKCDSSRRGQVDLAIRPHDPK